MGVPKKASPSSTSPGKRAAVGKRKTLAPLRWRVTERASRVWREASADDTIQQNSQTDRAD